MTVPSLAFLAEARAEVRDAFEWYRERSPRAAARFLAEVERAMVLIREAPDVWPVFEEGTRRYVLSGFPYSVIYRVRGGSLQVVALAHHKRKPMYWQSRGGPT
jgi:plasmid stabilization system protein ParE